MKRAIVLADERSARQVNGSGHMKALAKVGGVPLLIRNLRTLHAAGIEEAVVVTGYESHRVELALRSYVPRIKVHTVHNALWHLGAAHSVLAAANWIEDQCLLVPSDHLYPPSLVRRLMSAPAPADSIVIAVDRRLGEIFDENECLQVKLADDFAVELGTNLEEPDGVCAGINRISPLLVETLRRLIQDAEVTVLDCIKAAARHRRVRTLDVRNARWISISSPQARRYAELMLQLNGDTLEHTEYDGQVTLLNPGPVMTTPRVKAAVGARDMCHREPVFSDLLDAVQRKLRIVFGATDEHDVLVVTSSGTGGLEAAISTFVPREKALLVLRNGAFGERQAEIARLHGIPTFEVGEAWGAPLDLAAVERMLDEHPEIGAVGMVHHETSVALLNPVAAVGELTRARGVTLIVDTVASLGAEDIEVARDLIDVCVTSANKCLHAFAGLSMIAVRREVWRTIERDAPRSFYLDLKRYREAMVGRRQTPFTPAVNTMMSLDAALDELIEITVAGRQEHYRQLSHRLREGLAELGFEVVGDPARMSHSVTVVGVPRGLTYAAIYQGCKDRGFIIYECKGEMAGRYFQVANMGALDEIHIDEFLEALAEVVAEIRAPRISRAMGLLA